eukprot:Lankesteria_metandrocarpae@DN6030_c0_g1_i1.p1
MLENPRVVLSPVSLSNRGCASCKAAIKEIAQHLDMAVYSGSNIMRIPEDMIAIVSRHSSSSSDSSATEHNKDIADQLHDAVLQKKHSLISERLEAHPLYVAGSDRASDTEGSYHDTFKRDLVQEHEAVEEMERQQFIHHQLVHEPIAEVIATIEDLGKIAHRSRKSSMSSAASDAIVTDVAPNTVLNTVVALQHETSSRHSSGRSAESRSSSSSSMKSVELQPLQYQSDLHRPPLVNEFVPSVHTGSISSKKVLSREVLSKEYIDTHKIQISTAPEQTEALFQSGQYYTSGLMGLASPRSVSDVHSVLSRGAPSTTSYSAQSPAITSYTAYTQSPATTYTAYAPVAQTYPLMHSPVQQTSSAPHEEAALHRSLSGVSRSFRNSPLTAVTEGEQNPTVVAPTTTTATATTTTTTTPIITTRTTTKQTTTTTPLIATPTTTPLMAPIGAAQTAAEPLRTTPQGRSVISTTRVEAPTTPTTAKPKVSTPTTTSTTTPLSTVATPLS